MIKNILDFLSELKKNNNRDWFAENKVRYESAKHNFEMLGNQLISDISTFDEDIKGFDVKDAIFRIYRDTRFSPDKTPYKTHFGMYIASAGGRKSNRGGYYLHIEPDGCFFGAGVWMPQPDILKALRQSVYENIEEFIEIIENKIFKASFPELDKSQMLKRVPAGFPTDFEYAELLKHKSYLVGHGFSNDEFLSSNIIKRLSELAKTAYPFLQFLNYTVDEVLYKN